MMVIFNGRSGRVNNTHITAVLLFNSSTKSVNCGGSPSHLLLTRYCECESEYCL